ncbi:MAG TPA: hypothetical protein VIA62_15190 [Thermoanaerobaculia bacterium]|jgi:hypothetical protein|nr:hypothetical protein [Thermoanaerobaculia bacterium]
MSKRALAPLFVCLFLAAAGIAHAGSLPIYCFLDYYVSTQSGMLSASPVARICPVKVTFSNGAGFTGRTYACTIPAGQTSCSLTVDPQASGVPVSFTPQSAATSLLYSSIEADNGCVYDTDYPSARVDTMMMTQVLVGHRFDCATRP